MASGKSAKTRPKPFRNTSNATLAAPCEPSTISLATLKFEDEVAMQSFLEVRGRKRPDVFKSWYHETGFVFSVIMSQVLTEFFTSGFNVIVQRASADLDIPLARQTWPASAFPLVVCALLLPFGRLCDMYGGRYIYAAGVAWISIWAIIAGFASNEIMLDLCRASQGIAAAAFLPASLMVLGCIYAPGPRKNIVYAVYGSSAALGFFKGILVAGLSLQFTTWRVYFRIGAGIATVTAAVAWFSIPSDFQARKKMNVRMDWVGLFMIPATVVAIVFAITDSAHSTKGWLSPHILGVFFIGIALLIGTGYYEGWIAKDPLLPPSIFKVKSMKPLFISLLLSNGSLSIYMLYATFYMTEAMGASPMQIVAWFLPMAIGGIIIALFSGRILHLIPGTIIMIVAGVGFIIAPLLFALAAQGANYWHITFWAMLSATIAIDTSFTVSNVFISTSVPEKDQGAAGAINNSLVHLGTALFLGCADVVASSERKIGKIWALKAVFWFELGLAIVALVIMLLFVRIRAAKSDLTVDEKLAIESTLSLQLHDPYGSTDAYEPEYSLSCLENSAAQSGENMFASSAPRGMEMV